jgi:hypothetical protein
MLSSPILGKTFGKGLWITYETHFSRIRRVTLCEMPGSGIVTQVMHFRIAPVTDTHKMAIGGRLTQFQ